MNLLNNLNLLIVFCALQEDIHHEACSDVKNQLKFLQELNQIEKRKHDEEEREILLKVAKVTNCYSNLHRLVLILLSYFGSLTLI